MPLPSPILDDRSFDQLLDELKRRIPVYTPEWTDHNASDPGITILELFAHLGEALLFRFNQIPETTKLAFLRLLHLPLRPAVPARAMVAMTMKKPKKPKGVLVPLTADDGTPTEAAAGKIPFEIQTETCVLPVRGLAIAKQIAPTPDDPEELDAVRRIYDLRQPGPNEVAAHYNAIVLEGDPADEATHIDFGSTVDDTLWIAVLRDNDEPAAWDDFIENLHKQVVNIGVYVDEPVAAMSQVDPCPGTGVTATPPAIVWQISSGFDATTGQPTYDTLVPLGDTTRGLTQTGVIRLRLPRDTARFAALAAADLDDPNREGTDDLPPPIENEKDAEKVLFWLRAFRRDGGALRTFAWVGLNAAEVVQYQTAAPEYLGTGTAQANQQFALIHRNVVRGTVAVQVEEGGVNRWQSWQEVENFFASRDDDRHFIVDPEAGTVTFGNGINGRAPQIAERIRVKSYRYGGGIAGNVAAKAINKLPRIADVDITNVLPAKGGQESEKVPEALERIPGEFRRHDRAVAASDFRELALETPGAEVGRAEVMPLFDPKRRGETAPGCVSVVVWPKDDPQRPDAPLPTRSMLSSVCRWLDTRRLVTTELYVIPPTYRRIAVSVGIEVKNGYGVEAVSRWVELVLRQYLAPLPPYGPSGGGWPLGRRVHGPELEAAALQVEGVEFLHGLNVAVRQGGAWNQLPSQRPTIELLPWEVPHLTEITIVSHVAPPPAGEHELPPIRHPKRLPPPQLPDADPAEPVPQPPPDDQRIAVPVPIPVPKVEC